MVAYGDDDSVAQMLEPATPAGFSASLMARIPAMREVVSRLLDDATGRSFGTVGASRQVTVPTTTSTGVLVLPVPARTISEILYGYDDASGVISGGVALAADAWTVAHRDAEGNITALRVPGYWTGYGGAVAITGTWADADADASVPPEIDWATNYLTAKSIAEENASPAGAVGPDGSVVPIRNPWSEPKVRAIIAKYRLVTLGWVV